MDVVSGKVGDIGDMPGVLRRRYADMGVLTARSGIESYTLMDRLCLDKGGKEAVVDEERDWVEKSLRMMIFGGIGQLTRTDSSDDDDGRRSDLIDCRPRTGEYGA